MSYVSPTLPTTVVSEQRGFAMVTLQRFDAVGSEVIRVATVDGTATAGEDYLPIDREIVMADGQRFRHVVVPIVKDGVAEGEESLSLTFETTAPGFGPPMPQSVKISVHDRADVTAPMILHTKLVRHGRGHAIAMTFSEPMDRASVTDVANYEVRETYSYIGRPRRFPSKPPGPIRLRAALYDPASKTVTLVPAGRLHPQKSYSITNPQPDYSTPPIGPIFGPEPSEITDVAGNRIASGPRNSGSGSFYQTATLRQQPAYPPIWGPMPRPLALRAAPKADAAGD